MNNRINDGEQILHLLRRIATHPLPIARHIALATRSKDIFHLSNKQFLEILEKYELEIDFDATIENPSISISDEDTDLDTIIKEGTNLSQLRDELLSEENGY